MSAPGQAPDVAALKAALKARARELGFDLVGVCDARRFEEERAFLVSRQGRGIEPNPFEPPDADARVDPERVLPGARAIVAVGMSYLAESQPEETPADRLTGWFSRYCRGQDYHDVLGRRLRDLAVWLETAALGSETRTHVDVGLPLDRAIAQRAGLGRVGKSTSLIARGFGTWTFLGGLFTTVPLPPDPEDAWNVCGTCTRCLDACPTQCLSPWQIDSLRCLGYLNQASGMVPREYRAVMGNRLFGCDDCQDVCPYNATATPGDRPELAPRPGLDPGPDLVGLLSMSRPEFEVEIGPTAAAWRGLTTLQRNALVALGNSGDPAAFESVAECLSRPSPRLRLHASWALGRLAALQPSLATRAAAILYARLDVEPDEQVRDEIETTLSELRAHTIRSAAGSAPSRV